MTTAQQMYHINLDQIASLIKATGHKRTTLVQGHMGTGKSSLLNALGRDLPTHTACYFDCTTKDLGDITLPNIVNGRRTRATLPMPPTRSWVRTTTGRLS
jgi:type IV secretory pathway ATPase VirB11/archaellum biosynthesis ATPase